MCLVGGPDVDARQPLMKHLEQSFDLCAVGSDPVLAESFDQEGLRYRTYRMTRGANPLLDIEAVRDLVQIFRSERPDIVHAFDTKPCVWGRLAAKIAGVPVVIGTLPGLGSLYAEPGWKGRLVRLGYQPLQSIACRVSDRTVFQNDEDAAEFIRRHVVPRDRVSVIRGSGVDTDEFAPVPAAAGAQGPLGLGLPSDRVLVVMVSRILRAKGVLEYAAAARIVRDADPTVRFLLVGAADVESIHALTAAELEQLNNSVTWVGPRKDVKEILGLADVFAFPSFYREGIPRVLLEAASMGLPLVAADVPGSRDIVADGVNGYLVPPRDAQAFGEAVLRLSASPDLRRTFGERSRERVISGFSLPAVGASTESLYRSLLAPRRDR